MLHHCPKLCLTKVLIFMITISVFIASCSWLFPLLTPYLVMSLHPCTMMMSGYGNACSIIGPLCGESSDHQWFVSQRASNAELWSFVIMQNKLLYKQLIFMRYQWDIKSHHWRVFFLFTCNTHVMKSHIFNFFTIFQNFVKAPATTVTYDVIRHILFYQ